MDKAIVTTSIFGYTDEILAFTKIWDDWDVIYVSDKKTPDFDVDRDDFIHLTCDEQEELGYNYVRSIEWNRFQRKNIGYLYAIREGYDRIADVDDDNMPYAEWGEWTDKSETALRVDRPKYPNIYSLAGQPRIWPRGMPLDEVKNIAGYNTVEYDGAAVVQGLVDGDPDVDAICRLVTMPNDPSIHFNGADTPYVLAEGTWSPFNAQNTLWDHEDVFPLMYLPNSVTMRVCDILRSYVAQKIMWEHDHNLAFSRATVVQDRNEHDLMVDFEDETANYIDVKGWVKTLEETELESGSVVEDLKDCYEALIEDGYVDAVERAYLNAWCKDL